MPVSTRQRKNRKITGVVFPAICLVLSAYFSHHAINGRLGLSALKDAETKTVRLAAELADYKSQKEVLAHRVSLLKSGQIEKDILDEQARYQLNLAHENDLVLLK